MRLVALIALATLAGLGVARACPPGPCNKYRHLVPVVEEVGVYRRAVPLPPPARFDRRAVQQLLVASPWLPVQLPASQRSGKYAGPDPLPLRFMTAAAVRRPLATERLVLVRQLERRDQVTYVEVDGVFFALEACRDGRARSACLRRVGALPPDVSEPPHRFATPP